MRGIWGAFLATVPVAAVVGLTAPRLESDLASPSTVTLLVLAATLWVAFTAERDSRVRLGRIRRAFAVHGDESRLLRDHRRVLTVVLLRLEIIVLGGVVVCLWGAGPRVGLWITLLGGLMMGLAWPSARKTGILLRRARDGGA